MRSRALVWLSIPVVLGAFWAMRALPHRGPDVSTDRSGESGPGATTGTFAGAPSSAVASATAPADTQSGAESPSGVPSTGTLPEDASGAPRIVSTSPSGAGVALDAKIEIRFDRAVDPARVKLTLEPPAPGATAWPDPRTLTFTPVRYADGKPYHGVVEQPGAPPYPFDFRSLFPAPERVEPGHGQAITFTFDDGSDRPSQVTELLDLLQKEAIHAIFFPTGKWAEKNPALLKRMIDEGHRVCNHTYSHQNLRLPQLTEAEIRGEIERGATDGKCRLFRPPLKAFDPRAERIWKELGYTLYLWDVDSRDWEGATTSDIAHLILARVHPGAVLLFHMHAQTSLDALPQILPKLRKAGYVLSPPEDAGAP
ncbi:MAG: polysaccharide deacetylase family protein [Polyangiaceae bacterium]